ncbi:MAG: hypothetical protein AB1797_11340 [bacterium]
MSKPNIAGISFNISDCGFRISDWAEDRSSIAVSLQSSAYLSNQ